MTGTVTLPPGFPSDLLTHRDVTVTLNGVALPMLDAINGPVTFSCNPGDTGSVVNVDINAAGPAPASAPVVFVVPTLQSPPAASGVPVVTFGP